MRRGVVHHAWMQKHPTPTNQSGDFHWHPASTPQEVRADLAALAGRGGPGATTWSLEAGRLAWVRSYAETAPDDGRRYTGLVASYADLDEHQLCGALATLALPPARPFAGDPEETAVPERAVGAEACATLDLESADALLGGTRLARLVEIVVGGGALPVARPDDPRWPGVVGALLSWLPAAYLRTSRGGAFITGDLDVPPPARSPGRRALTHYLARAVAVAVPQAPDLPRRSWMAALDLARRLAVDLETLFEQFVELGRSWDAATALVQLLVRTGTVTAEELAACDARAPAPLAAATVADAGWLWSRLLNYWGRGMLAPVGAAHDADLRRRLAGLLARRVVMDHLFWLDEPAELARPRRYLRRLELETLIPGPRLAALRADLSALIPVLMAVDGTRSTPRPEVSLA